MHASAAAIFAAAAGFTAAGIVAALNGLVSGDALRPSFATPGAVAWALVYCAFAGPWLIASRGMTEPLKGRLAPAVALTALCGVWSFCSGVVVVEACLLAAQLVR